MLHCQFIGENSVSLSIHQFSNNNNSCFELIVNRASLNSFKMIIMLSVEQDIVPSHNDDVSALPPIDKC